MAFYARSAGPDGRWQPLRDHLLSVAEMAARFAAEAGLDPEAARWAGLLHDLGKYSNEFQEHRLRRGDWMVEHAAHGAAWAVEHNSVEAAFAVAGHHGGLPGMGELRELRRRAERCPIDVGTVMERARKFAAMAEGEGVFRGAPPTTPLQAAPDELELRIRMTFSCLVDADRLDAEAWGVSASTKKVIGRRQIATGDVETTAHYTCDEPFGS